MQHYCITTYINVILLTIFKYLWCLCVMFVLYVMSCVCGSYQQPAERGSVWSQQRRWWGLQGRWPRPDTAGTRYCPDHRTSTSVLWTHTHTHTHTQPGHRHVNHSPVHQSPQNSQNTHRKTEFTLHIFKMSWGQTVHTQTHTHIHRAKSTSRRAVI